MRATITVTVSYLSSIKLSFICANKETEFNMFFIYSGPTVNPMAFNYIAKNFLECFTLYDTFLTIFTT